MADKIANSIEENQDKIFKLNPLYESMLEQFSMMTHVFDLLTTKQRRVLCMFFDMELKHRGGDQKFKDGVFVGLEKISKITDVSERGIQYFLEKFRKDVFLDNLLKIKNRPYSSNLYEMSDILFFFLGYLKMEGALYQWDRHRSRILGYVHKDNSIIINRLQRRFQKLSTSVLRPRPLSFCVLLNVFTKYFLSINKVLTANASEVPSRKEEFDQITFSFGRTRLNLQQKKYLLASMPITSLDKALSDKRFYEHRGNKPKSDFALIYSRAKYHQTKRS